MATASYGALQVHPAANLFPMMTGREFAELVEDIRQHGQEEQIIVWRGQLLDGRNRLKACEQLGIPPNIGELDGDLDPVQYVLSHNLHRRHLTETQRAMVAAKLAKFKRGEVGNGRPKVGPSIEGSTVKDAAALLNVGHASVERAKKVIDGGAAALIEACERGDVAVSLAAKLVDECDDKREQARLAKQGKAAIKEFMTSRDYPEPDDGPHEVHHPDAPESHLAKAYARRQMTPRLECAYDELLCTVNDIKLRIEYLEDALCDAGMPEAACELDAVKEEAQRFALLVERLIS